MKIGDGRIGKGSMPLWDGWWVHIFTLN